MWLLSLFPSWFAYLLIAVGVLALLASMFLTRIPAVAIYNSFLKFGGIFVMVLGIYMAGIAANEAKWQERIKEMEEQVKIAEQKAKEANDNVRTEVVEKTKVIKEKGDAVIQYVDRVVKGDTQVIEKNMSEQEKAEFKKKIEELEKAKTACPAVPQLIIDMHNEAAAPPGKGKGK
jgi:uncharacterized membrane protein